jgi:MFS family permease
MAFLLVLSFLTYFDRQCIVWVKPAIQSQLHLSDYQMGNVLGAFWLAYALFDPFAGWLGDRFGAKLALTRVVLAWSLFTALTGAATGYYSILIYRFLFGTAEAGAYPNMARVQGAWLTPTERARAGGALWSFARFGAACSPLMFGFVLDWIDTPDVRSALSTVPGLADVPAWRLGFVVAGFAGVFWCLLFVPWFRNDPGDVRFVNSAELALIRAGRTADEGHGRIARGMWRKLLTNRSLCALAALYLIGGFGWSFFVSWMPDFLERVHGVKYDATRDLWKQPLLYGGVSCFVGGLLSDVVVRRTGRKWLGRAAFPLLGLSTAAVAMYAAGQVKDANTSIMLFCLAGGAFDFGQGANWATIVDVGGRYAGSATGFINLVGNMSNAVQPRVGAWVFHTYGWDTLFTVYATMFVLAGSMWFLIDPCKTFYEPETEEKTC